MGWGPKARKSAPDLGGRGVGAAIFAWLSTSLAEYYHTAIVWHWMPIFLWLGYLVLVRWHASKDAGSRALLGWLWLEELGFVGVVLGFISHEPWPRAVAGGSLLICLALLLRVPFPPWLFPLRKVWAQRFLAGLALGGFVVAGRLLIPSFWLGLPGWIPLLLAPLFFWLSGPSYHLLVSGCDLRAALTRLRQRQRRK